MTDIFTEYENYDALGLTELVRRKEVKPIELVETVIERIERINPVLNCVNIKTYDLARELAAGPLRDGPFDGVPFLLKDLATMYAGVKTTSGCNFYRDYVATEDSIVVRRLKRAGLILVGKTNTPELGSSPSTEPRLYGPTRNPWNLNCMAGGSSGGAAAAVAARIVPVADGSDGGGSIRTPASNSGVVGLKPSRGRVPLAPHYGDLWYGQVCLGCLSRTVRDSAAYLDIVGGPLTGDPYQPAKPACPFLEEVVTDPGRLKIGLVTKSITGDPVETVCVKAVEETAKQCAELGHEIAETQFTFDYDRAIKSFNRAARVLLLMALEDGEKMVGRKAAQEDFESLSWLMFELGKKVTGVQHARDIEGLRHCSRQIAHDCEPFDIVLTPTMPVPPQKLGTYEMNGPPETARTFGSLLKSHLAFTMPFNISGQPAMSLPLHWSDDGLPVGVQIVARYADEATIFRLAGQIEKARPWIHRKPPVCA
ncbi:amidase [Thermodesulfobacteriota bacterium]